MRHLRHAPGFLAIAVLTLATGIAAIVTMFSVYSSVVLHPVRVPDPGTLMSLYAVNTKVAFVPSSLSWPRFEAVRRQSVTLTQVGAYSEDSVALSGAGGLPEQLRALRVSGEFFAAIRAVTVRGRVFTPEEDVVNGPAVCVLSHELWQSRFGGREMVGETIQLNGNSTQVVGILAPAMSPPWNDRQVFVPRVFDDSALTLQSVKDGASFLEIVGRLRPGMTRAQADADLQAVSQSYAREFVSRTDSQNETKVRTIVDTVVGGRRATFALLLGAVALVLLVSCANAAALVLSRTASRRRDIAVRQALGATRVVIVRQLLLESLAIAALAGLAGLLLASIALSAVGIAAAGSLPPGTHLHVDGGALAVALTVVIISALLVGVGPALHITRPGSGASITAFVRGLSDDAATRRFRSGLVVGEVTLSVFLMVGATLLAYSLILLQRASPGFEPAGVAAGFVSLPATKYPTPEHQAAFFTEVADRLRRAPQVSGAAIVFGLPFHDDNFASTYTVAGRPVLAVADRARAGLRVVTEDYFRVMQIRLLQGRGFTAADRAGTQGVCVINASLARRQFAGTSPLGHTILRGRNADQAYAIVGVVDDVKTNGPQNAAPDEIFFAFRQLPRANSAIVARTTGDPETLWPLFATAVSSLDPSLPVARFAPMEVRRDLAIGSERLLAGMAGVFAIVALMLAAVGLYAVLAHSVATRTVEIGIRMAVGADRRTIVRLIVSQGLALAATGIGAGLAAAAAASRVVATQLHGVSPHDPWIYGLVAATFALVGVAASVAPALRASRVDPLTALAAR